MAKWPADPTVKNVQRTGAGIICAICMTTVRSLKFSLAVTTTASSALPTWPVNIVPTSHSPAP